MLGASTSPEANSVAGQRRILGPFDIGATQVGFRWLWVGPHACCRQCPATDQRRLNCRPDPPGPWSPRTSVAGACLPFGVSGLSPLGSRSPVGLQSPAFLLRYATRGRRCTGHRTRRVSRSRPPTPAHCPIPVASPNHAAPPLRERERAQDNDDREQCAQPVHRSVIQRHRFSIHPTAQDSSADHWHRSSCRHTFVNSGHGRQREVRR